MITMHIPVEFREQNLYVTAAVWNDLKAGGSTVSLTTVSSSIVGILKRGGAFIIYDDNIGIIRRFDRVSEFETYLSEINDQRKQSGLE